MTANDRPSAQSRELPIDVALDFINTLEHSQDADTEHLPTAVSLVGWLAQQRLLDEGVLAGLVQRLRSATEDGERALAEARALRRALRGVVDASVHGTNAASRDVAVINVWLRRRAAPRLVKVPAGLSLVDEDGADPIRKALVRLADAGARAVTSGDVTRLRTCANEDCRWAFHDTSRGGRRKWCDMASCGNRAKARRHRERQASARPTDR